MQPSCREDLESRLYPGTEGILSTRDGRLLEGFVTNLFIVRGESLQELGVE